ncbi:MAG: 4-oxalocrotonate tautomerase [Clostridiaceae bacterium]|jgi:4-oxalocrotonate tautomerase|nr:4-oxalocrotonate tautomerase [Clostridiaceae bacterium]
MPKLTIELFEGRTVDQKRLLCKKVTDAVAESLGVRPEAVSIVLRDMKPEDYCHGGIFRWDEVNGKQD